MATRNRRSDRESDRTLRRRRIEQTLLESEQRYRELFENASDVVYTHDLAGRFTSANRAAIRLTGYSHDELMSMTADQIVAPEYHEVAHEMTRRKLAGEATPPYELAIINKSRQHRTVEVHSGLIFRDGAPIGVQGIARDITEREQAERALRASEARYRSIIETALDAVIVINHQGVIEEWNRRAEAMFGWTRQEALGRPLHETIIPERYRDAHWRGLQECLVTGQGPVLDRRIELTGLRRDGDEFPIEVSVTMTRQDGAITFSAFLRDITAQHHAKAVLAQRAEELARSNAELEQFAYVASHDLQEPLRMVASYCQLLKRRYGGQLDADAHEFIDFAVDGAGRMQGLINDLLVYSRAVRGEQKWAATDIAQVVRQALVNLQFAIHERNAVVTCEPLPTINADASQLIQLFQNLIGNAIKFCTDRTPAIHVSAQNRGGEWLISVRDNGIGIAPEHRERIFLIFKRLHVRGQFPGTGIGLAICKKIAECHGGRIWVESTPGEGSVFQVTFPHSGKRSS